jgi:4-cresol dehydrogenase (hydroxylating)
MTCRRPDWEGAIRAWREVVGPEQVLTGAAIKARYGPGTTPVEREIPALVMPGTTAEVQAIVAIARHHATPLYPVSTGNNWGYGDHKPLTDGCAVVSLHRMARVVDFDADLGVVTIEPGVTQQILYDYLQARQAAYMVPTTGAGPHCSVMGNALERGFGPERFHDHFQAVTGLTAVLPDGSLYRGALTQMGGAAVDRLHKWGFGPYLDGLFSQGNFGIVTAMSLQLAPVRESMTIAYLAIADDRRLAAGLAALREAKLACGNVFSAAVMLNNLSSLALCTRYPFDLLGPEGYLSSDALNTFMDRHGARLAWSSALMLFDSKPMVGADRRTLAKLVRPHASALRMVDISRLQGIARLLSALPKTNWSQGIIAGIEAMSLPGRPNRRSLRQVYWKRQEQPGGEDLNPARDGMGSYWYAPMVPFKPDLVRRHVDLTDRIIKAHQFEPLQRLFFANPGVVNGLAPIYFEMADAGASERAKACYDALLTAGAAEGFLPYRTGIDHMASFVDPQHSFWQLAGRLKQAIDPDGLIAPGRYGPAGAPSGNL